MSGQGRMRRSTGGEVQRSALEAGDRAMETRQIFERARASHVQGNYAESEALYRRVLELNPGAALALEGLGVLMFQQGRTADAATFFERGVAAQPGSARMHANLAEALRVLGRTERALQHVQRAQSIDPAFAQAWNTRGLIAYDEGRFTDALSAYLEAIAREPRLTAAHINQANALQALHRSSDAVAALRQALRVEPDNPTALSNLGQVLCDLADPDLLEEAELLCRRAAAVAPGLAQAHEYLGNVLRAAGRMEEALKAFQQSLRVDSRRAAPLFNIGQLLQHAGRFDEAAAIYDKAKALDPDDARLHISLGALALARDQYDQAVRSYRRAAELDPLSSDAQHGLGMAFLDQGRLDLAESAFREALRLNPAYAMSQTGLARIQAERGDLEKSCALARRALEMRPNSAEAYHRLASNLKGRLPEAEVEAIRRLIDHKSLPDASRAMLRFGLAAVYDARGLYRESAALLDHANQLQGAAKASQGPVYDPGQHSRLIDRFQAAFTPDACARSRGWIEPDPRHAFIVGLPRSGTTLVEQILASHHRIHGAGELYLAHAVFQDLPKLAGRPELDPFAAFAALGPESARAASRQYVDGVRAVAPAAAERVVDKMPDNFRLIGLIAVLWPGARVIVCGRDPRDVAVSCWQTGFESNAWANHPDHIAQRIADYERMMRHWRATRPLEWLDVRYEEVVADLETSARRMIDFVGLDWDPACLAFHKTRRVVRTASVAQVREPIYSQSVGKWRHYAPHLGRLFDALERQEIELGGDQSS
jgi:tetratricopeptide (TPR) repeat protein